MSILLIVSIIIFLLVHIAVPFFSSNYLSFFYDDFSYYLNIVMNFYSHGLSSYDGVIKTNGYQPLWMVILYAILLFTKKINTNFFIILQTVNGIFLIITYFLIYNISKEFIKNKKICLLLASYYILWVSLFSLRGMEITTLNLMISLMLYYLIVIRKTILTGKNYCVFGFIGALTILSRLDSIIFVALLLGSTLLQDIAFRKLLRNMLYFMAGLIPFYIYLAVNIIYFKTLIPVSGLAKQLKVGLMPSWNPLFSLILHRDLTWDFFNYSSLISILFASYLCLKLGKSILTDNKKVIACIPIIFYYNYYFIWSVLSDWFLPPWYFYPAALASLFSLIIICTDGSLHIFEPTDKILNIIMTALILITVAWDGKYILMYNPLDNGLYTAALSIREFEKDHPGIYAMGDRAGSVGFLIRSRLIQLEGLVMDKEFLKNIRDKNDLIQTLKKYHVNYYIATYPREEQGCYYFSEPAVAGRTSPKMSGKICQQPVYQFKTKNGREEYDTGIFQIE